MKQRALSITVDPLCYVGVAFLMLLLPLRWICAIAFSIVVHEFCHIAALKCCKVHITGLRLGLGGAVIYTGAIQSWQEAVCAAAGPMGGLLLSLLSDYLPCTAFCAVVHSVYNLIPLQAMDGGRILEGLSKLMFNEAVASRIICGIQWCCMIMGCIILIALSIVLQSPVYLILLLTFWLLRSTKIKFPCKRSYKALQ